MALSTSCAMLAVHIMAVVAAFGPPLAYPPLIPGVGRVQPPAMPGVHDAEHRLDQRDTAGADGPVTFGPEHQALHTRDVRVERLLGLLVLVAISFMAAKPIA
jgi:hypothetical protein